MLNWIRAENGIENEIENENVACFEEEINLRTLRCAKYDSYDSCKKHQSYFQEEVI